ncbi:hypothetical protein ABIC08_008317 [Bradyrhizobium sp. RT9b]|uniref:hypothetical protein n=1 Tax=unclassified Bradyrhizobium TaxID=2631580 RepID=UPI0033957B1F
MRAFAWLLTFAAVVAADPAGAQDAYVKINCNPQPDCENQFYNEMYLSGYIRSWVHWLDLADHGYKSEFDSYVGLMKYTKFGETDGLRALVIIPSELVRDSTADWDSFELVVGHPTPMSKADRGPLWISTENYKRRSRSLFGPKEPSPDWEFTAVSDNDVANARLQQIADSLKKVAESRGNNRIVPAPAVKPQ